MPAHPLLIWLATEFERDKQASKEKALTKSKPAKDPKPDERTFTNIGGDEFADIYRERHVPADLMRKIRYLTEDRDAQKDISNDFHAMISMMIKSGFIDKAHTLVDELIEKYEILVRADESGEDEIDYDTKIKLIRKEAQRMTAQIRFSHPKFRSLPEERAYGATRGYINGKFGRISFDKAPLEVKEQWVDLAKHIYRMECRP